MAFKDLLANQVQKEGIISYNFKMIEHLSILTCNRDLTSGLEYHYYEGIYPNSAGVKTVIPAGFVTVTVGTSNVEANWRKNYIVLDLNTLTVSSVLVAPTSGILLATVETDLTQIRRITVEMTPVFFPVGTKNNLVTGGSIDAGFITEEWFKVSNINNLNITLSGGALFKSARSYTSNGSLDSQSAPQNTSQTIALTANQKGYIYQKYATGTGNDLAVTYLTGTNNNFSNSISFALGVLYYFETNATTVTRLVDATRSNMNPINYTTENLTTLTTAINTTTTISNPFTTKNPSGLSSSFTHTVMLKCTTAEHGYVVNDLIPLFFTGNTHAEMRAPAIAFTGTNAGVIKVLLKENVKITSMATGETVDVTPANWSLLTRITVIR